MVNEDERTKEFVSENVKISVSFVDNTQDFEFLTGESTVKVP
jgi:hypothetical protein